MQAELRRPGVGGYILATGFAQTLRNVQVLKYDLFLLDCPKLSAYKFALLLAFSQESAKGMLAYKLLPRRRE